MKSKSRITTEGRAPLLPRHRPPTHPGEMLNEEFLLPMRVTQTQFAKHLGWTHAKVNEIIRGKRGITTEASLAIADALGTTPDLWLNLQRDYDLWHALRDHKKIKPLKKAA